MSVFSALLLQRLAPAITAFVVFLNSVGGLFGVAPVIPYNPERTDVVVSGEISTDVEEILGYYNAAVKKTNKSFVIGSSSTEIIGNPEYILSGNETVNIDDYWQAVEETKTTIYKVPGEGNIIASDVKSAKMSVKDGKRSVIINIKDCDTISDDSPVGRAFGYKTDLKEGFSLAGVTVISGKFEDSHTNSVISCVIDDDSGKIIYGDWDTTGSITATNAMFDAYGITMKYDKITYSGTTYIDI